MRRALFIVLAMFFALSTGSVMAEGQTQSQTSAKKNENDRIICKSSPKTGTRFGSKTCMTAREWEEVAENHRRAAAEMIDRAIIDTRRGN
ncbi:hypothetical protein [uncultured Sphingosinicella sp.]|uniref:hypothetical protein n=1 Tax=uncultured Sphingosinicella sp. TaxID=478748 RepID=UPI0030D72E06|tara:strand:- start:7825 stop:8094 length:270 start_codon:yes stop_codon:yes gene_type:complete